MFLLLKKLEHVFWREHQLHVRGSPSQRVKHSSPSSREKEEAPGKAYQVYTLYRDKDGQIKQVNSTLECNAFVCFKPLNQCLQTGSGN